jgi:hypothetical protein
VAYAIIDMDYIKYACAAIGEKRTVLVTHTASGREMEFRTRTEFYGRDYKSGWLGERNAKRDSPFEASEFVIKDVQTPEPIAHALHTAKLAVSKAMAGAGMTKYKGYVGAGDSFRVEASTILKYKGNRKDMLKPLHLDAVSDYLTSKLGGEIVTELEADDVCSIECYKNDNVMCAIDKDSYGTASKVFNPTNPDAGVVDCDTFGMLHLNDKGNVKGYGRLFYYFQIASGDKIDNYKANSASKVKWADKSAYNVLKYCSNDAEALKALVNVYQHLYPEKTQVKGWRGELIDVDWLYMLTENMNMARMFTSYDDHLLHSNSVLEMVGNA